jgi:hypothetical protein
MGLWSYVVLVWSFRSFGWQLDWHWSLEKGSQYVSVLALSRCAIVCTFHVPPPKGLVFEVHLFNHNIDADVYIYTCTYTHPTNICTQLYFYNCCLGLVFVERRLFSFYELHSLDTSHACKHIHPYEHMCATLLLWAHSKDWDEILDIDEITTDVSLLTYMSSSIERTMLIQFQNKFRKMWASVLSWELKPG